MMIRATAEYIADPAVEYVTYVRGPVGENAGTKMRFIIANVLFVVMLIPHVLTWLVVVPSLCNCSCMSIYLIYSPCRKLYLPHSLLFWKSNECVQAVGVCMHVRGQGEIEELEMT